MKGIGMMLSLAGVLWLQGFATPAEAAGSRRLGAGVNYWRTLDDVDVRDVDESGFSWHASAQWRGALLGLQADLEWFDKNFGAAEKDVFAPQAYLLVGRTLYGAAGIGWYYSAGSFSRNPFYALRAGLDLELLPKLFLDIHANYRFEEWDDIRDDEKGVDTDTVTLGASVRIAF